MKRKSHWVNKLIPGDGKWLWSLYIVNISLDPFHNLVGIWVPLCDFQNISKLFTQCHFPFTFLTTSCRSSTLQVWPREKKMKCSLPALAFKTTYRGLEFGLGTPCYSTTLGIFASFLLCSSCRLGSLEYKNMQRMHVNAVQLQNDNNYITYISYTLSDLIQEYPGPSN